MGGSLHYTTIGTLTKHDNMLRAMFSGRMEVLTDSEGKWFTTWAIFSVLKKKKNVIPIFMWEILNNKNVLRLDLDWPVWKAFWHNLELLKRWKYSYAREPEGVRGKDM